MSTRSVFACYDVNRDGGHEGEGGECGVVSKGGEGEGLSHNRGWGSRRMEVRVGVCSAMEGRGGVHGRGR